MKIGQNPGMFLLHFNENESPSDLDWEEVGDYGADSEVEQFLKNNEETQGYEHGRLRNCRRGTNFTRSIR